MQKSFTPDLLISDLQYILDLILVVCALFREVMIIVQAAENVSKPVEAIKTSKLEPYKSNTKDPYITAYLKTNVFSLPFVIGDGKKYNFQNTTYVNLPLQPNTSYTVFLRFIESQVWYTLSTFR